MTRRPKPNDVVYEKNEAAHWSPFGRVWRVLDDGGILVIDCTKHIRIYNPDDLLIADYKGRWDTRGMVREKFPVWMRMPSLRKLKQMTSGYNPDVWKRKRKGRAFPAHTEDRRSAEPQPVE